ncbi:hypothetical protein [Brucella sp. 09RB8471]|uniref:hypothetical protein n=1 Tax=Brucella sp. 09RB8471 TaxID=1149952 RepID=UPI0009728794|nr:hypothetical protein [Brucella sp. 09RB8471]APX68911.1 hypothetical protein BKD03_05935 [Brucella sp. 09RB8471]
MSDYTILGEGEHFTISHIGSPDTIQFTNFEHLTFDNIASVALTDIVASSVSAGLTGPRHRIWVSSFRR